MQCRREMRQHKNLYFSATVGNLQVSDHQQDIDPGQGSTIHQSSPYLDMVTLTPEPARVVINRKTARTDVTLC